jgi:hypothetical protein
MAEYKKGSGRSHSSITSFQKLAMFGSSPASTVSVLMAVLLAGVSPAAYLTNQWPPLMINQPYYGLFYLPYRHYHSTGIEFIFQIYLALKLNSKIGSGVHSWNSIDQLPKNNFEEESKIQTN